ncbi:unnamed protein product [Prunus armeniaca]|uniref:Uncharacterized protein n=1 Tax=Prunus armeniaca TaxID=36596 RepID=A0A6J5W170_PRUAR|nr:unnamed protein product [Prunus armeniaca]
MAYVACPVLKQPQPGGLLGAIPFGLFGSMMLVNPFLSNYGILRLCIVSVHGLVHLMVLRATVLPIDVRLGFVSVAHF